MKIKPKVINKIIHTNIIPKFIIKPVIKKHIINITIIKS